VLTRASGAPRRASRARAASPARWPPPPAPAAGRRRAAPLARPRRCPRKPNDSRRARRALRERALLRAAAAPAGPAAAARRSARRRRAEGGAAARAPRQRWRFMAMPTTATARGTGKFGRGISQCPPRRPFKRPHTASPPTRTRTVHKAVTVGQEKPDKTTIITIIIKRRLKVLEHRLAPPVRRGRVVRVVRVKVGAVERARDGRQPGRLDALREQALPVDAGYAPSPEPFLS
jgi:hypothetical protein